MDKFKLASCLIDLYDDYCAYIVSNKKNYVDSDFDFQPFIKWVNKVRLGEIN
mgnify:CR=1 FL=1